jgi:hypothetical protein
MAKAVGLFGMIETDQLMVDFLIKNRSTWFDFEPFGSVLGIKCLLMLFQLLAGFGLPAHSVHVLAHRRRMPHREALGNRS